MIGRVRLVVTVDLVQEKAEARLVELRTEGDGRRIGGVEYVVMRSEEDGEKYYWRDSAGNACDDTTFRHAVHDMITFAADHVDTAFAANLDEARDAR